jgi:hypothetical protein
MCCTHIRNSTLECRRFWMNGQIFFPSLHAYKHSGFPSYQITARDVATGALWYAYAREKSTTNTKLFIEYLCNHLKVILYNMSDNDALVIIISCFEYPI